MENLEHGTVVGWEFATDQAPMVTIAFTDHYPVHAWPSPELWSVVKSGMVLEFEVDKYGVMVGFRPARDECDGECPCYLRGYDDRADEDDQRQPQERD